MLLCLGQTVPSGDMADVIKEIAGVSAFDEASLILASDVDSFSRCGRLVTDDLSGRNRMRLGAAKGPASEKACLTQG